MELFKLDNRMEWNCTSYIHNTVPKKVLLLNPTVNKWQAVNSEMKFILMPLVYLIYLLFLSTAHINIPISIPIIKYNYIKINI